MKSSARGWLIQSFAEFVGTAMFLYLAIGGADAVELGVPPGDSYLGTSFGFGIALMVVAWSFFHISGSHFNPAISFSSFITGHIPLPKFILYFIAQFLGALVGVALVRGTTPSSETTAQVMALAHGESITRGFFLEFFLTAMLCFVYHMTIHEKNRSTFMAAIPVGFTLFACHLLAARYTNGGFNPARAFATSAVTNSFTSYQWIFWFGPLCGSILAAALHILFRFLDYDKYTAGIDAENAAQYERAQAAVLEGENYRGSSGTTGNNTLPR
ncbi:hypothetical protein BGZ58_010648 [Dissophora ornata]|nr:hypothetical protein BGZ58_010648 [Dissophora ornata]